ncbi:ABC transporter type 1, transmembrane domain-containing protein [Parasitella parasitica]|nr:ABC transporter type 1, transmembrane domain-containing protein [Parasitella parasitica]
MQQETSAINDFLRLPTTKTVSVFRRSIVLLIVTLLEISSWAFVFAWRLESAILERSKDTRPPLYQIVDPSLAFVPRIYVLALVIKSFTTPANPVDPSKFTRYSHHFLLFYALFFVSALIRVFDYFFTDNNWFISSGIEKSFSLIDLCLCFILWFVVVTSPTELDQGELVDFDDDDHGVLVLHDGRVVRNGRVLSLESTASPLSSLTFSWMNSLLKSARRTKLTAASLWALPTRQRARENFRLFTETKLHQHLSNLSLIHRIYTANKKIIWCQFITAIAAVVFHYANPFFLRKLLIWIQEHHQDGEDSSNQEIGYMYCAALFGCNVISTLVASQTLLWGRRWHVTIIHMLNSEIYAHALRLKSAHQPPKGQTTTDEGEANSDADEEGDVDQEEDEEEEEGGGDEDHEESVHRQASLMSQDTERLAELASYLHIFYTCPLEIAAGAIFLYQILGNSFLAGLIVMVVALPSTHYISRRLMQAQSHLTDAKSWRLRLLRELCDGIKTIKFLASERRWEQAITNARDDELVKLIKLYTQNTILGLIWFATPVFVTTISFAWYTLVEKKTLDASTAFVSIVLFGMLRDPLNVMPQAFMAYSDARLSLSHITAFLNTEEKEQETELLPRPQDRLAFSDSIFAWPSSERLLTVPTCEFPLSKLSIVCGPPSSGKTSLIAALMGDMPCVEGQSPACVPRVAYVAQTAWIEHGTLRDNILFSEPWDDTRYRAVLHQCDLLRDLSMLDNGDLTLTTDKAMSNAMRLKISLARAVYAKLDTVIIDDIFNAFPKMTSTFIYENCIRGELMRRRTILVTLTWPDMFWARDAQLFVNLEHGRVDAMETDPEKIVALIKLRRAQRKVNNEPKAAVVVPADVIDALYESTGASSTHNTTLFEEDCFDEASIIPDSIRQEQDESITAAADTAYKSRDYAYATYYSACGGWRYWMAAILFTLFARLANISESYWLKEGTRHLST